MTRDSAEKQKQKAKEMLGISDDRAKEIFEEQPDRKQQKKKELEQENMSQQEAPEKEEQETEEENFVCEECGDGFDSKRGLNSHKGQVH